MVSLQRYQNSVSYHVLFVFFVLSVSFVTDVADALGTFGFDIHHRYSDAVKKILGSEGLPEKDTVEYFTALVHRDHLRGRRLAAGDQLTFSGGNETLRVTELGFLQYVHVKVGTPGVEFLVALDSGTDFFWVPCECRDCPRSITLRSGTVVDLNIYALNGTSTMTPVPCSSTTCGVGFNCVKEQNICAYKNDYIYSNTSSTGLVLQDVLQLRTNENPSTSVNSTITFGCGVVQTGSFLKTTAMNGLLGLGMGDLSVPSILATQGLTANSFSLCSGPDGVGRIVFGDQGSLDQSQTPFSISASQPNYIVSIEQVTTGTTVSDLEFTALLDTGLAFTRLSDPVYTTLAESFNSQVLDRKLVLSDFPLEYCYELSSTSTGPVDPKSPNLAFTMKGGSQFYITNPIILLTLEDGGYAYCLAVLKGSSNVIGLNFMVGQKMIFNRETNVLGWKLSECYGNDESDSGSGNTPPPPTTSNTPPPERTLNTPPPPRTPFSSPSPPPPTRTVSTPPPPGSDTTPDQSEASPPPPSPSQSQNPAFRLPGHAAQLNSFTCKVVMAFFSFFTHYFIFHN